MPYVTEEIYQMLPIKEESIMISNYPKYNQNQVFTNEVEQVEKIIIDIVAIRNLKATNQITKDAKVKIEVSDTYKNLYFHQLKIQEDNLTNIELIDLEKETYKSSLIEITYYFEGNKDNSKILEEIESLEKSIERRQSLLNNPNYVNKAPANIVELDRKKLSEEIEKLNILKEKV